MPLDQEKNCEDITNVTTCQCTHPIQTVQINSSKPHLFHSCLDLIATINLNNSKHLGLMAFLVAKTLTLKQVGTLERVELFSDAVNTFIEGFSTTHLTLVSPGNNVTLSKCHFVNATVEIISAENALIEDTNFTGKIKFDEKYEKYGSYFRDPFPSSTSTFTIATMNNLHLSATDLSQVLLDTSRVKTITVENNSSFDVLWKLKNPYQIIRPTSSGKECCHCYS